MNENSRAVIPPTILYNEPAIGAQKNWKWGYLPCGCLNDGYGHHIYDSHSRLNEADAYLKRKSAT